MEERSFDLLLNDDEYLERVTTGEFVVIDAVLTSDQVRRLAMRLLELRGDGELIRLPAEPVLGLCPHKYDLDREFCPHGCRV
jgi:predicted kinase